MQYSCFARLTYTDDEYNNFVINFHKNYWRMKTKNIVQLFKRYTRQIDMEKKYTMR